MLSLKSALAKPFAKRIYKKVQKWANNPIETQHKVFQELISTGTSTQFGQDHDFVSINTHEDFVKRVSVRDYEGLKPYVERVVAGEENILWKGKPLYFAKTSGTTSGSKYIPITKESMPSHVEAARNAILFYIHETGNAKFVTGKMIFLQGSPILEEQNGVQLGRLSGKGMLLQLNSGIFYEFIKADAFFEADPKRITIGAVEVGVNYVMIISTNAGLWSYNLGDTVEFTSTKPYRVIVSGRIKHFISAFGEHVIGKEVELAMQEATKDSNIRVSEFTVAPQINPEEGLPYHEWFIEFENEPEDLSALAKKIDASLQKQNTYYFDLIQGKVLQPLKIRTVKQGGFQDYMKSIGKLGGQNKLPRLSNDRKIADNFPYLN